MESVTSGYSGGKTANPTYSQVCEGTTEHAEVIEIRFDPEATSYRDLLSIFFAIHDPTTLNRQGNDLGTQYRSVIFCTSLDQEREAKQFISELEKLKIWDSPIVTDVVDANPVFPAESYHQQYFRHNPDQGYCALVIGPKVANFRKRFRALLKPDYR